MPFGVQSLIPCTDKRVRDDLAVAKSPMPFGVQSLIPQSKPMVTRFGRMMSPMPFGVQSLIPIVPLFVGQINDWSPMPFGVQSLIPRTRYQRV